MAGHVINLTLLIEAPYYGAAKQCIDEAFKTIEGQYENCKAHQWQVESHYLQALPGEQA